MFDVRPVWWITGLLLCLLGLTMLLPAAVDLLSGNPEWSMFLGSGAFVFFVGAALIGANLHRRPRGLTLRQTFLAPVVGWSACAVAAALPFIHWGLSPTDALFEAISGVTATGATVLPHLERLSPGMLLWRSLLQWLGGAGTLALGVLILPALKVGGMQIFRVDTSGRDDPMAVRATRILAGIYVVYAGYTLMLAMLLRLAGMDAFDAVNHALTTISCGGFSTSNGSIGHWHSANVDWVILIGMLAGGAPFAVHLQLLSRNWRQGWANTQLRWYLVLIVASALLIAAWLMAMQGAKPLPALRHGLFAAASVMTGTGFATRDWAG